MTENELAIEQGLRAEVTEAFMGGLKKLFIESNINVPDESLDVVADMNEKLDDMETRLNEQVEKNIALHEAVGAYRKNEILTEHPEDLQKFRRINSPHLLKQWNSRTKSRIVRSWNRSRSPTSVLRNQKLRKRLNPICNQLKKVKS